MISFISFLQDAALKNQTLVGPVLGSSVANMSISNLKENIQFTIRNANPIPVSVHTHENRYYFHESICPEKNNT